jgi:hypothetical protein
MTRTLKALFALFVLFAVVAQPISAAGKTVKIKVTLVSMKLVENDHVGNEWYTVAYANGKTIEEGNSVTFNLKSTDSVSLKAYAEEQDKVPDKATTVATLKVSSITKPINKTLNVTVTENRGRYSGNTAKWQYVFKIQKV